MSTMAENVPKLVLTAVFSAIVWLSVEPPIDRVISVGELLSGSVMIKVKFLLKVVATR
jgi:hypothetical protein